MTTISAVAADGGRIELTEADITGFRNGLRGSLLASGQDGYESARRVWNGNVDRRPALIARCAGVADVQQAVNFARTHRLLVSVRGGGHAVSGYATNDDGLVIDLSALKGIQVDPAARTARAQAGVLCVSWIMRHRRSGSPRLAAPCRTPESQG
jgi:FAD/FMN-containing dehydrogenase